MQTFVQIHTPFATERSNQHIAKSDYLPRLMCTKIRLDVPNWLKDIGEAFPVLLCGNMLPKNHCMRIYIAKWEIHTHTQTFKK